MIVVSNLTHRAALCPWGRQPLTEMHTNIPPGVCEVRPARKAHTVTAMCYLMF
jgi:hypothetical protein